MAQQYGTGSTALPGAPKARHLANSRAFAPGGQPSFSPIELDGQLLRYNN
jgi:hypothetical protein